MSQDAVETLFGRALTNPVFRARLLADGQDAIDGYDLTAAERRHVLAWTAATFDDVTRRIEAQLEAAAFDGVGFQSAADAARLSSSDPVLPPAALRRFVASVLPELTPENPASGQLAVASFGRDVTRSARDAATGAPPAAPAAEARLRNAGIIRHLTESSLQWGELRLHQCSGLYGGPYADGQYVLPGPFGGRGLTPFEARVTATAEAAERFAGAVCDERMLVSGCAGQLAGNAVLPSAFALYSDRQYAEPGFPYARFDDDTCINWTWGLSLLGRRRVLVPAQFVHHHYWHGGHEARLADLPTTGLACGRSLEEAALQGLYEVIEREAIAVTWFNRLAVPRADADAARWVSVAPGSDGERTLSIHDITTDLGIPVRLAIAIDHAEHIVSVGAASRLDPRAAADKAAAEAVALGPVAGRVRSQRPPHPDGGADEVRTLDDHMVYYCHPDRVQAFDFLRQAAGRQGGQGQGRITPSVADELATVLRALQQRALDAIVVDLTLPDVAAAGLTVVRAIVPGLIPLTFGQRLVAKGGARLYQVPVELGYRSTALREDELNPSPHPFA